MFELVMRIVLVASVDLGFVNLNLTIYTLSQRNHSMDVDIPYQTGSSGKGTLNWPFCV